MIAGIARLMRATADRIDPEKPASRVEGRSPFRVPPISRGYPLEKREREIVDRIVARM